ncbi:hypothetical protein GR158_00045 [Shinella sp. AETb1-6]|uniref:Uncharacterized protein n=1 Tax=Shinella sumterensis TaxID=1967501 RepID=A0AA50CPY0_9HYPH|nr:MULTISPECIES: hypothetical protein [Shinella]MDP9591179.1 hypothetical protein [Shinella zoogloeoides]MXN49489.1 hypothetical protein [Shinella sp. AETb1-6]WLR98454.1 hypothetical protein Q9313_05325 [Shinella sumterensis]WLS08194.1 hypothetical protein Q9314_18785 [Shinella sumterensis]
MDKIEPVSGRGEMDHAGEAIRELIFSGCDGTVDFLMSGRSLDAISLLV